MRSPDDVRKLIENASMVQYTLDWAPGNIIDELCDALSDLLAEREAQARTIPQMMQTFLSGTKVSPFWNAEQRDTAAFCVQSLTEAFIKAGYALPPPPAEIRNARFTSTGPR